MASSTAWLLSRDHRTVNILLPDLWCHNDEFHFISLCFNTFAPWCLFKSHCSIESIWGASAYKMSLLKMSIKRASPMVPWSWQLFLLISSSLRLANLSYFFFSPFIPEWGEKWKAIVSCSQGTREEVEQSCEAPYQAIWLADEAMKRFLGRNEESKGNSPLHTTD